MSAAGDGIFYLVSPPDKLNLAGHEVGFFDIEEARDYFPLPFALTTPVPRPARLAPFQHRPDLFAALYRDALFYIVEVMRMGSNGATESVERKLYRLSVDGREVLVDTAKRGDFLFVGTP